MKITEQTLALFLAFANDAGNWSGTPLVGGNVGGTKEDRGNITQMKRAKLITTDTDEGCTWIYFTEAGKVFAAGHGVEFFRYDVKQEGDLWIVIDRRIPHLSKGDDGRIGPYPTAKTAHEAIASFKKEDEAAEFEGPAPGTKGIPARLARSE